MPTEVRAVALGSSSMMARVAAMFAPAVRQFFYASHSNILN
jgi:hypothetical protein